MVMDIYNEFKDINCYVWIICKNVFFTLYMYFYVWLIYEIWSFFHFHFVIAKYFETSKFSNANKNLSFEIIALLLADHTQV